MRLPLSFVEAKRALRSSTWAKWLTVEGVKNRVAQSGVKGRTWRGPRSPPKSQGRTPELPLEARFFGKYEHSLDAKGRVILPAKLRLHFNQLGYLTRHLEGCLALWTAEEFAKEIEVRLAQAEGDPVARNGVREWAAAVFEAQIDPQGRMAVPAHLRSYAKLGQEVLIIGMINRVELWSPASWEAKELPPSDGSDVRVRS